MKIIKALIELIMFILLLFISMGIFLFILVLIKGFFA